MHMCSDAFCVFLSDLTDGRIINGSTQAFQIDVFKGGFQTDVFKDCFIQMMTTMDSKTGQFD